MVLAIDIGGTYIKYGYVYGNTVEGANKFRTEFSFSKLCEKIDVLVNDNTERIAISSGGFWDNNGESIGYETIVEMRENNLVEYLKNKHNVPVTILNDARCALLCEKEYGALKGKENAVVFVLGNSASNDEVKVNHSDVFFKENPVSKKEKKTPFKKFYDKVLWK